MRNEKKSLELFELYLELPIRKVDLNRFLWREVLEKAYVNQTTVYDTAYHVLAISLGWKFLTRDLKYAQKAEKLGFLEVWSEEV